MALTREAFREYYKTALAIVAPLNMDQGERRKRALDMAEQALGDEEARFGTVELVNEQLREELASERAQLKLMSDLMDERNAMLLAHLHAAEAIADVLWSGDDPERPPARMDPAEFWAAAVLKLSNTLCDGQHEIDVLKRELENAQDDVRTLDGVIDRHRKTLGQVEALLAKWRETAGADAPHALELAAALAEPAIDDAG